MRRLTAILIIFVVLVASVGPVLGQTNNTSVTGNSSGVVTNGTTAGTGGVTGNISGGNTTGNATNGSTGTGVGVSTGISGSAGTSSGESSYGSGYLSDTLNNNTSSGKNGSIAFGGNNSSAGNGTNNSSASGLSSDADGVKGIAINAALDVVARFLKFIANSITSAMDFLIQHMVGVLTWTPHPPRGDMYMAAGNQGTDTLWGGLYNQYRQLWQPFALLCAAFLTFMYLILGPHALDKLPSNVADQGLYSVAIAWMAASDVSWVMMGLILDMANLLRQGFLSGIELQSGTVGAISIALVAMIMVFLVGFWIALGSILLYGFRIVAIIALTPMMPAIFAARAIPIQGVSDIADSLWRLWFFLAILPIPVGGVLAVGFGTNIHDMLTNSNVVGTVGAGLFGVIIQTGTLLAALILPYLLYQRSSTSAMSVGLSGMTALDKVQDHFSSQEERVKETRQKARQTSPNLPSRAQNVAIKANKVGLLNRGGARADGGTRTGGGGGSNTKQTVYVKNKRRRKKLEK